MSFRHVIVAFDGSPQAEGALALALRLRDPDEGELTLACVVPGGRWHVGAHAHRPDAAVPEEIERLFADTCARMIPAGIRVRRRAPVAPSPARGLTELAESEDADLIVIGSSRHAEPGRIRLERTAGRLLQGAPCAVAIAPGGLWSDEPFRHVGIAYDGSPEAGAALHAGYEIAAGPSAAVTLIFAIVTGGLEAERERLDALAVLDGAADAAPPGVNPATRLLFGAPAQAIREASDGIVDLLVAGSRGYGPMQRALLGSVSEMLIEGAPQPVLVLARMSPSQPDPRAALDRLEAR
jgi:nucleotide-binding universal stress UspA family protein